MRQGIGETGHTRTSDDRDLHSVTVAGTVSGRKDPECFFVNHRCEELDRQDKYGIKN
jgi:hypothetical protein